jgi:hypothetical protein
LGFINQKLLNANKAIIQISLRLCKPMQAGSHHEKLVRRRKNATMRKRTVHSQAMREPCQSNNVGRHNQRPYTPSRLANNTILQCTMKHTRCANGKVRLTILKNLVVALIMQSETIFARCKRGRKGP